MPADEHLPRELAVSPAIGPLPPIHLAPPPRRTAVGPLRRVAAWAGDLADDLRHRYRNPPAGD
jgi:hypothetical protein